LTEYAPPPLLPPNRRVRRPKTQPPVVAAPERVAPPARPLVGERLRAALGVVLTVAVALGCAWGLVRYTRTSRRFSVQTVDVDGVAHRTAADIRRLGRVELGANMFTIDTQTVSSRISADPWIEKVTVTRRLPGTLRVEVVERDAAALVAIGPQLYVATRQGVLFKRLELGDPSDMLVVTGLVPDLVARDLAAAVALVKRALDLAGEYDRNGPSKALPLQEVHVHDDGAMSLVVGHDPIVVRMGMGPYRQTIEQAARVLAELPRRGAQASVVFLDNEAHPERVVVRTR
jgi:cell division protein FtsQ